eukprot:CAMPEP_0172314748 /NCGR_PEP_ID=MMETSP1058-20130122/23298_1 /TAXON_ID=83371 /ORGANISM="Detonula confervacea, Strain CCMP 353" /LENGTH=240 /DNA_ID=CAMNT_0013028689 /DNA_START=62 /DNA_END=784 /DNA_ORIENTATION=-
MTATNSEEILVLYGSQTGNSEGAAQEICSLLPTKVLLPCTTITARVMHLDDFLELEKAAWTRLVIIVCSSYGVGQAPIGARKFRDFCDAILEPQFSKSGTEGKLLEGVNFALLGLGDSHYTTYFHNPTTIHKALTAVGATHIGELGKADASGTGDMEQSKVIDRWITNIWGDLAKVVAAEAPQQEVLDRARDETWGMCLELFPEWKPTKNYAAMAALYVPLLGVIVAILAHLFLSGSWAQ